MIKASQISILSKPSHKRIEIKQKTPKSATRYVEGATPKSHYVEKEQVKVSNALLLGPALGLGAGAIYSKLNNVSMKKGLAVGGGLGLVLGAIAHKHRHNKQLIKDLESIRRAGFVKEAYLMDAQMASHIPIGQAIKDIKSLAGRAKGVFVKKPAEAEKVFGGKPWYELTGHNNPALSRAQKEYKQMLANRKSIGSASKEYLHAAA